MCGWGAKASFNFFPTIKRSVDDLLDDRDGYAQNPKVNIELIAKKTGIKDIRYVPQEEIWKKYPKAHAYLDKENSIIYVSNNYGDDKQRFLIAHELFHFLFILKTEKGSTLNILTRRGDMWKKEHEGSAEAEGEDIADFFAANLLVPTEHFILWDEKSDNEIAIAFGVEEECISKRRKEIEYELRILTPEIHSAGKNTDI